MSENAASIHHIREEMRFEADVLNGRINALISAEAFLTIAFTMALGNPGTGHVALILSVIGFVLAVLSWPGVNTGIRIINEWNTLLIASLEAAPEATRLMWRPSIFSEAAGRSDRAHRRGMVFARSMPIVFALAWSLFAGIAVVRL
ncbi:hypothetical protein [Aureimonas leprariae]|uniref:Uncharacterized protein n=1 Tax=Plantimonas leprariae TaxID=2615207 RepID=A0A7V7PMD6_9HYPH|nr:hypothetical protein [Aureimonas leprariae]KAB0678043.1 hypothetical protein F6X38_16590 [Aureimonas leprariae]